MNLLNVEPRQKKRLKEPERLHPNDDVLQRHVIQFESHLWVHLAPLYERLRACRLSKCVFVFHTFETGR